MLSRSKHKVVISLKQLIANIGIAKTTTLNNTPFLHWDKSFTFYIYKWFHNFIMIFDNALFLDLSIMRWKSRYFSYCWVTPLLQSVVISTFTSFLTFLLNTIVVLSILKHWPDSRAYFHNMYINCWEEKLLALQKMKLSSANNKWLIFGAPWHTLIPSRLLSNIDFLSKLIKSSIHKRKR